MEYVAMAFTVAGIALVAVGIVLFKRAKKKEAAKLNPA